MSSKEKETPIYNLRCLAARRTHIMGKSRGVNTDEKSGAGVPNRLLVMCGLQYLTDNSCGFSVPKRIGLRLPCGSTRYAEKGVRCVGSLAQA